MKISDKSFSAIIPPVLRVTIVLLILCCTVSCTTSISNNGVTYTFAESVRYGTFANGDYWVVGPVTIESISPDFNGLNHGFEINPSDTVRHGFDDRIRDYDASLVPSLPYVAQPGESVVKTVSTQPLSDRGCRPCVQSASVLTVLADVPANEGDRYFRPAYFGTNKTLHSVDDIQFNLLPNLAPTQSAISLETVANNYSQPQLDHKDSWLVVYMHPEDSMPWYASSISTRNASSALALMMNASDSEKYQAVVNYVNNGLDLYYMHKGGVKWRADGGNGEGRKLPAVIAAVLLGNTEMINDLANSQEGDFGENRGVYKSTVTGDVLWGQWENSEYEYWKAVVTKKGGKTQRDPYQMIDGGNLPNPGYQFCCTSKPWEATVAALKLMPSLKAAFNVPLLETYAERWRTSGLKTQPDNCAPATGIWSGGSKNGQMCTTASTDNPDGTCDLEARYDADYGVLYGPDPQVPGQCIQDVDGSDGFGRVPHKHNTSVAGGHYGSTFANEIWEMYL